MYRNYQPSVSIEAFSRTVNLLRSFCLARGFIEVHTQDRLSILAACEDPTTVATYEYGGKTWPLPQTGQMWLEYELLTRPDVPGVFCVSTSYRNEPNPVPGRHDLIFPMFEFESRGGLDDLRAFEEEICEHLGLGRRDAYPRFTYDELAARYGVDELEHEHEARMHQEFGRVVFLEHFPERTSPFWNMKRSAAGAHKIDVIIDGIETIGSAERSSDPEDMRTRFHSISGGEYARLLYGLFGEERVEAELEDFFALSFTPRYGGGIGLRRLIRAVESGS